MQATALSCRYALCKRGVKTSWAQCIEGANLASRGSGLLRFHVKTSKSSEGVSRHLHIAPEIKVQQSSMLCPTTHPLLTFCNLSRIFSFLLSLKFQSKSIWIRPPCTVCLISSQKILLNVCSRECFSSVFLPFKTLLRWKLFQRLSGNVWEYSDGGRGLFARWPRPLP